MYRAWASSRPALHVCRTALARRGQTCTTTRRRLTDNARRGLVDATRQQVTEASKRTLADTTVPRPQIASAAAVAQPQQSPTTVPPEQHKYAVMDGNEAAAYIAYAMSDISFIYPISPASPMGEYVDAWAGQGERNIFQQVVNVNMMQSEAGAAGALHGACAAGALSSTFTASQGLLLMIPVMYKLAGELMPTVLHVAARTVSKQALSIFNDHSDVMATRQTGFAMMCSTSVQDCMDLALVSHLSAVKSRIPFLHFFDGYRTSAEMSKIKVIPKQTISELFPREKVEEYLHNFALNPNNPMIRGTIAGPDICFQMSTASNKYYQACPDIVEQTLLDLEKATGRRIGLFDYHGSPTAERVAVCMGSSAKTMQEAVDYMNDKGENVGVVSVHLYRPWSHKHFLQTLPETCKKLAVLDRTREDGASGNPLYLDVNVTMSGRETPMLITGGTYGLASKEFTPAMAKAVFDNLDAPKPKSNYVVGIDDDVTHSSLAYGEAINTIPKTTHQCLFWGLGADGTVGASKQAIQTIGLKTDLKAQGHFVYGSHKSDGVTVSHLRFGPDDIKAEYLIQSEADYLSCSHPSYVKKYEMIGPLKKGGTFVLNSPYTAMERMERKLPAAMKREIAEKEIEFYNIDASAIAKEVGLGKRVNMIMQAAFFGLSGVLPRDEALRLLKASITKIYRHKGPEIIDKNHRAVDAALDRLQRVEYPASWAEATTGAVPSLNENKPKPGFVSGVMDPVLRLRGDNLPVSAFEPGGFQPVGTTQFEKRGIATSIPVWKPDACTQCNYCAIACPHAVIRPFLLDKTETRAAPTGFETRKAKGGAEVAGYNYTIQVSPYDCTGCEVCVEHCPDDALVMAPAIEVAEPKDPHWNYAIGLPEKGEIGEKFSVKGSQFMKPLLEFSGACTGCGETPYIKLATQLFGERMVIANATGCTSVWGATSAVIPYTNNQEGRGPAWGNSLFEDNAEYGFGMMLATKQRRIQLQQLVDEVVQDGQIPEELQTALSNWSKFMENPEKCKVYSVQIEDMFDNMELESYDPRLKSIYNQRDMLRTQSHWIIGGDGWAYDIGYGGLEHVLSRNENVNILVLDTEMYSNTGGQMSKATQLSAVVKMASSGKRQNKKDLGLCSMQYGNVYVASVALGANMNQTVQAFKEAEHYDGTSIIIALAPCIDWGFDMKRMMDVQKLAVECGYWSLYRYDPRRREKELNPFQLDSRTLRGDFKDFLHQQNRFKQLVRQDPEIATRLQKVFEEEVVDKHSKFVKMAMDEYELLKYLKEFLGEEMDSDDVLVLYGSETGNAANLAQVFASEFKRRDVRAQCMAMDDVDVNDLPKQSKIFCVVATCGQGEFPNNSKNFWKALSDKSLPSDFLQNTKFAMFGLGDSSYVYYNEAAKKFDTRLRELGAESVMEMGMGDDKDEDKYETKWNEWLPELWNNLDTKPPKQELLDPTYDVAMMSAGSLTIPDVIIPPGTKLVPMTKNVLLTPPDYDRDIRHYEFDLSGSGLAYGCGDCMGIFPHNHPEDVDQFLHEYGLDGSQVVKLSDKLDRKQPYPEAVGVKQLFTEVLDIFGKPSRRFFETLQMAAKDESEKNELEHILGKDGKERMAELRKETITYADLLKMFPSSKLNLDYLLDHVSRIKPRLYSIASSSEMHGDTLQLCIVKDDWTTPSGQFRHGLCTRYLMNRDAGTDMVSGNINAAGITIPDSHAPPYIMVGLGTGIAPFRAMVEEREMARRDGETVGGMALFFGARYKATDYTYGDEFEEYHSSGKGVLSLISTAFSRDQEYKIYVQNRISEHPDVVYDYLHKQKGYFYLCGPAGNVPPAVRQAVCDAFVSQGGHSPEEAEKLVTQMQIEGRYNVEAW